MRKFPELAAAALFGTLLLAWWWQIYQRYAPPPDGGGAPASAQSAAALCAVTRIVDGDTVRVRCGDGPEEPVRLVGVDAPEVARQGKPAECGSANATEALASALAGGEVALAPDPEQVDRDRYGRLLRFLATTTTSDAAAPWRGSVNLSLVRSGAGRAYADLRYGGREEFEEAERAAASASLGLWGKCPYGAS
jgi:micrococcal nuclease